ncbi:MAG: hypothetical protein KDC54_05290, partial [Lewinella sp.]|nr:hypothetical protein [Lewinella sp.]
QGIRFYADGEFVGEDRPAGALLTVWVKPKDKEAGEQAEGQEEQAGEGRRGRRGRRGGGDEVTIKVVNAAGDTVRTFTRNVEPGFNRFSWYLETDGVDFPSRRERRGDFGPRGGDRVLPGLYTLIMTYGDQEQTTEVMVHSDPRIEYPENAWAARTELSEDLEGVVKAATEGFNRLREARETIGLVERALTNAPDSLLTKVKEQGKALRDSLDALELLYMDADDVKGIIRTPDNLTSTLRTASRYISDVVGEPSQMALVSLEQARSQTEQVLEKVNAFLENDFAAYRQAVEAVQYSLFKEMAPVKME